MITAASAQPAAPAGRGCPGCVQHVRDDVGHAAVLGYWSAATSFSHFVKKPATSMLKAAVREKAWASPVQPSRSSRCGQSVGTSRKLPFCPQTMLCWSWLMSGLEVSNSPARRHVGVDDDAGQAVGRQLARVAVHRHVAEAEEGEVRLEGLRRRRP